MMGKDRRIQLGYCRFLFNANKFDEGAKLLMTVVEENADWDEAWFELGMRADDSQNVLILSPSKAAHAFDQAIRLAPNNAKYLEAAARHFRRIGDPARAISLFRQALSVSPKLFNQDLLIEYVTTLRSTGATEAARQAADTGILRCESGLKKVTNSESATKMQRQMSRLLIESGQYDRFFTLVSQIRQIRGGGANFSAKEYFVDSALRLRLLRERIHGRDLMLFLQGPSYLDFEPYLSAIKDRNVASAALGDFRAVEQTLSTKWGKHLDAIFVSHPDIAYACDKTISELSQLQDGPHLITSEFAVSRASSLFQESIKKMGLKAVQLHPTCGPPMPREPLHFISGNSLAVFLPFLCVLNPARIFLVGADGGAHPERGQLYFSDGRMERAGLDETLRRYVLEANECDTIWKSTIPFLKAFFDLRIPPIYNICMHSSYRAFPRIDNEEASLLLRGGYETGIHASVLHR